MENPVETRPKTSKDEPSLYDQMSPEDQLRYDAWEKGIENGITPDNPDRYMRYCDYVENGFSKGMIIDDALRLSNWENPPSTYNYLKYKSTFDNSSLFNPITGKPTVDINSVTSSRLVIIRAVRALWITLCKITDAEVRKFEEKSPEIQIK